MQLKTPIENKICFFYFAEWLNTLPDWQEVPVFDAFMWNFHKHGVWGIMPASDLSSYVRIGFKWEETLQGFEYWQEINFKWQHHMQYMMNMI